MSARDASAADTTHIAEVRCFVLSADSCEQHCSVSTGQHNIPLVTSTVPMRSSAWLLDIAWSFCICMSALCLHVFACDTQ